MYDINIENIGKRIKYYRKAKSMSTEELGKDRTTISRYESSEIISDILTMIEICNAFNIDMNSFFDKVVCDVENSIHENPFDTDLLYLYYISTKGIVISSIEIEENKYTNRVLMKNGVNGNKYAQEYTGVMETNYNTAFICLTNAINNPGLDKFQIEIDLHSKVNDLYYGLFLGVSSNTHKPTARKCILTNKLVTSEERLNSLFNDLQISEDEIEGILEINYWDMTRKNIKDYIIKINNNIK